MMQAAYVDTSCLLALQFREPRAAALGRRLASFDQLFSANLLEAEFRSACAREGVVAEVALADEIAWVVPGRPLHDEIAVVLRAGTVRGADCWHLASALFLAAHPSAIAFLTLDDRQGRVARTLGFLE